MSISVIVPAAGKSSRFPDMRPKWMLTHPTGNLMLAESIKGLDLKKQDMVYITLLEEHVKKYDCLEGIKRSISDAKLACNFEIVVLSKETKNQPETVYRTITDKNITGAIFIKDADNFFKSPVACKNAVCNINLKDLDLVNASNKSYVDIDDYGIIKNIVEKSIISATFCTGGYSFQSAQEFCKYYEQLKDDSDLYVSHIIYKMLLDGHIFHSENVTDFVDWGTIEDWNRFKSDFSTIFLDIDGVVVKNSSRYFGKIWGQTQGIDENIAALNSLWESGKVHIVLTTSRCQSFSHETERQLSKVGLKYDRIIYNLPHAKRIIINDYSNTAPYKNCDAINFPRNANNLKDMLASLRSK